MYMLTVEYKTGTFEYYGPFPTPERAMMYARAVKVEAPSEGKEVKRNFVSDLITPYSVVKTVIWRRQDSAV